MMGFPFSLGCIAILSYPASPATAFGFSAPVKLRSTQAVPQNVSTGSRSSNLFSVPSELGAIAASNSRPRLNPALIEAALIRLPWETESGYDEEATAEEIGSGERWLDSRKILTRLWVLPRDMSNGAWEPYATAANNGEDKVLSAVPQLLRLSPGEVEKSAKTVLSVLRLPPAMLRREPLLLTMPPDRLMRGFEGLLIDEMQIVVQNMDRGGERLGSNDETIASAVREACKDTPGLLLEAAKNCGKGGTALYQD